MSFNFFQITTPAVACAQTLRASNGARSTRRSNSPAIGRLTARRTCVQAIPTVTTILLTSNLSRPFSLSGAFSLKRIFYAACILRCLAVITTAKGIKCFRGIWHNTKVRFMTFRFDVRKENVNCILSLNGVSVRTDIVVIFSHISFFLFMSQKRDILTRTKQVRDALRIENVKLRQKCGLLGNEPLLRDYEERKEQVL